MGKLRRSIAYLLVLSIAGIGLPVPVQAGMISTERLVATTDHTRISQMLDRADVRAKLEELGVKPADVKARVVALTDAEAAQLARSIDNLPAGADGGVGAIVGALVLVFLVLLITDLLGLTKVFPFTKPIR
jgi:hypothetical protein